MMRGSRIELETGTESLLAAIWQDLLDCRSVAGESNFFDLGGHSLKVVLMLMRIHEVFGVSLGIEDVYAAEVTLERMARRIDELIAFGGVGHSEYTRILGAIEQMSEEEAEEAWREESRTNADPSSR
jgi:acyl carrier protein